MDDLRDDIHARELEINALNVERQVTGDHLAWRREKLKTVEQDYRRIKEELSGARAGEDGAAAQWRMEMADLRRRFHEAAVAASETERLLLAENIAFKQADLNFLKRKLDVAASNAPFTREELDSKLQTLDEERNEVKQDLDKAIQSNVQALDNLSQARENLKVAREQAVAEQSEQDRRRIRHLEQVVETRRIQAETSGIIAKGLNQFGNFLVNMERQVWLDRWQLAQNKRSCRVRIERGSSRTCSEPDPKLAALFRFQHSPGHKAGQHPFAAIWRNPGAVKAIRP